MSQTTASAKLLDPALQVARHLQQDANALLARIGISAEALQPAGARIPASLFSALLEELGRSSDNPRIALRTGEVTQPRMLGSVGFLISTAPTLGDALQCLNDYLPLLIEGVHLGLERDEEHAWLVLDLADDGDRPLAEWLLACLHNWPRWLIGKQMPLTRVEVTFAQPPAPELHEQFFAAEVQFEAPRNRLSFNAAILDQPCLDANEELHRHHQQFADQLLSSAGRDGALVAQVKSLIRNQLGAARRPLSRQQVAERLNLSLRTLQRKLDQQGTHFQELYDQTRRDLALQMIHRGDRAIGEISYQLGFSGLSAFQKAFKRWTGQPPGLYRASHRPQTVLPEPLLPRTLSELIPPNGLEEDAFYPLALQLLQRLAQPLAEGAVPALSPSTVSVASDERGELQLSLGSPRQQQQLPLLEQLNYCAPEASGLLPERPTVATRLYEFGCLCYTLLHGTPPYSERDPGALLRAQLQQTPPLRATLSAPLAAILKQLLRLEPLRRYQSLYGLEQDLREAERRARGEPHEQPFQPARHDQPQRVIPPSLLCGRAAQQQLLHDLLQRSRHNDGRLLLIEAATGSGKSALTDSLRTAVYRSQGTQLRIPLRPGDERRRLEPIYPALRRLLRIRLAAPPARRELLAQQLQRQLGVRLRLLLPHLPELRALVSLPEEERPAGAASASGLSQAILTLLTLLRDPLLLFFDDLQHSSPQLLELLLQLRAALGGQPLLLIASLDPTAAAANPALAAQLPLLRRHRQTVPLSLPPLGAGDTHALLRQLLGELTPATQVLGDWLQRESQGQPARLAAQLDQLRDAGKLRWDPSSERWQWLPEQLPEALAEPLGQALVEALATLPAASRELLQWAAAAGERFELQQLASARQDPLARLEIHLWPAQHAGLIHPDGAAALRFAHPRLRHHLLGLLSTPERALRLWQLADALPATSPAAERARRFTEAYRAEPQPGRREQVIELQRRAAAELQQSGDRAGALAHLDAALALLEPRDLTTPRPLALRLYRDALLTLYRWRAWSRVPDWLARCPAPPAALPAALQAPLALARAGLRLAEGDSAGASAQLQAALATLGQPLLTDVAAQAGALLSLAERPSVAAPPAPDGALLLDALEQLAEAELAPELLRAQWLARAGGVDSSAERALLEACCTPQPPTALPPPPPTAPARQQALYALRLAPWHAPLPSLEAAFDAALQAARDEEDGALAERLLPHRFATACWGEQPLPELARHYAQEQARCPADAANPLRLALGPWLAALTAQGEALATSDAAAGSASPWAQWGALASAYPLRQRGAWPALLAALPRWEPRFEGTLAAAQLLLFASLIRAELGYSAAAAEQRALRHQLQGGAARFARWAEHNPALFALPAALLEAESAALHGAPQQAGQAFDRALQQSGPGWLLRGLARERSARFWQRQQQPALAELLQREMAAIYAAAGINSADWQPATERLQ